MLFNRLTFQRRAYKIVLESTTCPMFAQKNSIVAQDVYFIAFKTT